ncbi:putative reverse transcriptase domain-containing protein [Tanacetum coccineum]
MTLKNCIKLHLISEEKSVATGANARPILTCYGCGEQGHMRNRCPKKLKKEDGREACGYAYAIKDVEPQGPNVVTGTFPLNNRYDSILFDSGSDRSFVNTRFSSLLDNRPIKIDNRYEVKLADGTVRDAVIVYGEKVVHIPYLDKMLIVEGDKVVSQQRGEKLEDVPVIHDFPEVFPDDLSRLPLPRQLEFKIDLVLGVAHVA